MERWGSGTGLVYSQKIIFRVTFTQKDEPRTVASVQIDLPYQTTHHQGVIIGATREALTGKAMEVVDEDGKAWFVTNCSHKGVNGTSTVSGLRVQNNTPKVPSAAATAKMWQNAKDIEAASGLAKVFVFASSARTEHQKL